MKVLLLNDTTNRYHYGCTATSTALISGIERLRAIVSPVPITETYKIKEFPLNFNEFKNKERFESFTKANFELINLIKENDAVVINSEGTLHGLNHAPASLLYLAYIAKKIFGKHVEIINHSVYPEHNLSISNSEESLVCKLVYNTIDFSAIREPLSFVTMKELGVTSIESFDCLPLYIKNNHHKNNKKYNNQLLIAGSASWLHYNIYSTERGDIDKYHEGLSEFCCYLGIMNSKHFKIKFIYGASNFPAKDNREFLEYLRKNFHMNLEVYEAKSLNDWLKTIEMSTILISGRFHHTIAATCLGTNFIALNSNTPKISGLIEILNAPEVINYTDKYIYEKLLNQTNIILDKLTQNNYCLSKECLSKKLCTKAERNFLGLKAFKEKLMQ